MYHVWHACHCFLLNWDIVCISDENRHRCARDVLECRRRPAGRSENFTLCKAGVLDRYVEYSLPK